MMKLLRPTLVVIMLLILAGCASLYNPATGKDEFILINSGTEKAIGRSASEEYIKEHPITGDQQLQERLNSLGSRISRVSDRQDIEYSFYVVEDSQLNAVTLPGGSIYVNRGLIDILNDDELGFVLAHEVGHTAARHIAKKIQAGMTYQMLMGLAFAGLGDKSASAENIARGADTVFQLVSLSYSRQDEYQADALGVKYMNLAGFDPHGSITALEKIKTTEGPSWKLLSYFRTHPYIDERIESLKVQVGKVKGNGG